MFTAATVKRFVGKESSKLQRQRKSLDNYLVFPELNSKSKEEELKESLNQHNQIMEGFRKIEEFRAEAQEKRKISFPINGTHFSPVNHKRQMLFPEISQKSKSFGSLADLESKFSSATPSDFKEAKTICKFFNFSDLASDEFSAEDSIDCLEYLKGLRESIKTEMFCLELEKKVKKDLFTEQADKLSVLERKAIERIIRVLLLKYPHEQKYTEKMVQDILKLWKFNEESNVIWNDYLKLYAIRFFLTQKIKNLKKVNGITKCGRTNKAKNVYENYVSP